MPVAQELPTAPELPASEVEASASSAQPKIDIDDSATPPPVKKSALSSLLGDVYIVKIDKGKTLQDRVFEEISNYKLEDPIPTKKTLWVGGKPNKKFPLLSVMAKKLLCIPATSVPSGRSFPTTGEVVTTQRSKPEIQKC